MTLANNNEFGIGDENKMFIGRQNDPMSRIYPGKATVQNFRRLLVFMKQL